MAIYSFCLTFSIGSARRRKRQGRPPLQSNIYLSSAKSPRKKSFDDFAVGVTQAEIAALGVISEPLVVQSEQVQMGC